MYKKIEYFFLNHYSKLGIKKNDKVLVYSDLSKFGIYNKNLPKIVLESLKKVIGKKGTILMPFYLLNNNSKTMFDKKKFNFSKYTGNLVKIFIKDKKIVRSKSLIHNHVGLGPDAKILNYSDARSSIGKNSDFEFIKNSNFKLLLLGCTFLQGATYLHHLEAIANVPYRKWIKIKKKLLYNKKSTTIFVDYFARKSARYISNFNSVFTKLKKLNLSINIEKIKYGNSICMSLKKLDKAGLKLLKKNKYCFVKKKEKK